MKKTKRPDPIQDLRNLGEEAENAILDWDDSDSEAITVTDRLTKSTPSPVRISAAFWDTIPRHSKAWLVVAVLAICAAVLAYALHLGLVPWFFKKGN